jgi:hypothetical protein
VDSINGTQAQTEAVRDLQQYLTIKAPFDGIITEALFREACQSNT